MLWWPVAITGIFTISALSNTNQQLLTILAHGALMLYVVLRITKNGIGWQRQWQYGAIIGGVVGGSAALMVALYKLATMLTIVYIFNLATQPLFTGLLDAVLAGFLTIIIQYAQRSYQAHGSMAPKNQTPESR